MTTNEIVTVFRRQVIRPIMLDILMLFEAGLVCRHFEHNSPKVLDLTGHDTLWYLAEGDAWVVLESSERK